MTQVLTTVLDLPLRATRRLGSPVVAAGGVVVVAVVGGVVTVVKGLRRNQPVMPRACQGTVVI